MTKPALQDLVITCVVCKHLVISCLVFVSICYSLAPDNTKTLTMLYNSLIYPHLLYGVPIWGNADDVHLKTLLTIQKKAVRIISNKDYYIATIFQLPGELNIFWSIDTYIKEPSAPLFKNLKILTIYDIFKAETLKFVYDSLKKTNPTQFHKYFNYAPNLHNTAANRNNNLNTPSVRTTTYGLKSLRYSGSILWNNLPCTLRNKPSKIAFAKSVKEYLISLI